MVTYTERITGKDVLIKFLPTGTTATHVQKIYIDSGVTAGSLKLTVNGEETAAITFSVTPATFVSAINSALDALNILGPGELVATGTVSTEITLTGASGALNRYFVITISDNSLTGTALPDPSAWTTVITQGAEELTISTDLSKFDGTQKTNVVDVTAISEFAKSELAVSSEFSGNMSIYGANQSYEYILAVAGMYGKLSVWYQGLVDNTTYFVMNVLFTDFKVDIPDHDVVEYTISFNRVGENIVQFGSKYYN